MAKSQADMGFDAAAEMESVTVSKEPGGGTAQVDYAAERWNGVHVLCEAAVAALGRGRVR